MIPSTEADQYHRLSWVGCRRRKEKKKKKKQTRQWCKERIRIRE